MFAELTYAHDELTDGQQTGRGEIVEASYDVIESCSKNEALVRTSHALVDVVIFYISS